MDVLTKNASLTAIVTVGTLAPVGVYCHNNKKGCSVRKLPAPPASLAMPFVGNFWQLSVKTDISDLLNKWAETYGPIYMVHIGPVKCIVLNTMAVMDQAMGTQGHSSRPNWLPLMQMVYENKGLVWSNDDPWRVECTKVLKNLCCCTNDANSIHERMIVKECGRLICELCKREEGDCAFNPKELITKAITNIICSLTIGGRYKYKSARLEELIYQIHKLSRINMLDSTTFFPFLAKLPGVLQPTLLGEVCNMAHLVCFFEEEFEAHRAKFDPNHCSNLIDLYLREAQSTSLNKEDACKQSMEVMLIDLFVSECEPIASALNWAILCMIAHPEVQAKCHEEIDAVTSMSRLPCLSDMSCLPYVKATIYEVLRRFTVLPLGVPHATSCGVELAGHCVPGDAVVVCNLQAVHLNEFYWESPSVFSPDRFYDDDLKGSGLPKFVERDNCIPFGIGPPSCVGKELSRDIFSLMFVSLLHRFDFNASANEFDLTSAFDGCFDYTFKPRPYCCKIGIHQASRRY